MIFVLAAVAAPFGTVDIIASQDGDDWTRIESTPAALRERAGTSTPLTPGMLLETGDIIRTKDARVRIRLEDQESLFIGENSEVTLQERSILQKVGLLYLELRGAFRVTYGTVEAVIEGTRFVVTAEDESMKVSEGAVRVRTGSDDVLVEQGMKTTGATSAQSWPVLERAKDLQQTWVEGHPHWVVGAGLHVGLSSPGFFDAGGPHGFVGVRGHVRLSPIKRVWVTGGVQLDVVNGAEVPERAQVVPRLGVSAGVAYDVRLLLVGGELMIANTPGVPGLPPIDQPGLGVGAFAVGRRPIPLSRTLFLDLEGRAGFWPLNNSQRLIPYLEVGSGLSIGW